METTADNNTANAYLQLLAILRLINGKQRSSGILSTESDFNCPQESPIFNIFGPYDNANPVYTFVCDFLRVCFSGNVNVDDLRIYSEAYRNTTVLSDEQASLFECAKLSLLASLQGYGPVAAQEFGRQGIPANMKPSWFELEEFLYKTSSRYRYSIKNPKPIRVFLKIESTPYRLGKVNDGIISIGLTTEDGHEFYAELTDTYEPSMCSSYVIENVLPQLEGGSCCMTVGELPYRLYCWFGDIDSQEIRLISDYPSITEFPFIQSLFEKLGWPCNLSKKCEHLNHIIGWDNENFDKAIEEFWLLNAGRQHHALVEARSILFAWNSCRERSFYRHSHIYSL